MRLGEGGHYAQNQEINMIQYIPCIFWVDLKAKKARLSASFFMP
jgi:hypothetical protein